MALPQLKLLKVKLININQSGRVEALNTGLNVANGEYIAILDADDEAYPERIEKQLCVLRNNPNISQLSSVAEPEVASDPLCRSPRACAPKDCPTSRRFRSVRRSIRCRSSYRRVAGVRLSSRSRRQAPHRGARTGVFRHHQVPFSLHALSAQRFPLVFSLCSPPLRP